MPLSRRSIKSTSPFLSIVRYLFVKLVKNPIKFLIFCVYTSTHVCGVPSRTNVIKISIGLL